MLSHVTAHRWDLRALGAVGLLATLLATAGCNECDFEPRCEGNVMVTCGGIDQQVGRKVSRSACSAPNPVCVNGPYGLFCARSAKPVCTPPSMPGQVSRCEGQTELRCLSGVTPEGGSGGYEVALDCGIVHMPGQPPGGYECKTNASGGSCQPR